MKLAICVTGQYRPTVRNPSDPKFNLDRFQQIFYDADVYYHTYDKNVDSLPNWINRNQVYSWPEPENHYHPVNDTPFLCPHQKFHDYRKRNILTHKTAHAHKQILSYANLIEQMTLPQYHSYDILIRIRWDTAINMTRQDIEKYFEYAMNEGPVGFMTRANRGPKYENGNTVILPKDSTTIDDDWYCYLPDTMILHSPKHFDPKYVQELFSKRQLWPAEWGWWQTMSEPYNNNHLSVHGGVIIAR